MTVESDWSDWLLRAVEDADPDGLALWYLGCNGFVLKSSGGTTVFIDPYLGIGDPPRTVRMIPVPFYPDDVSEADAVLGTHEHTDHVHGPSQAPILANTGADYYTTDSGHDVIADERWVEDYDVESQQLHEIEEGDTFEVGDLTIHVEAGIFVVESSGNEFSNATVTDTQGTTPLEVDTGALVFFNASENVVADTSAA
jgi:L-ascorbate 6-phosphate lactonase